MKGKAWRGRCAVAVLAALGAGGAFALPNLTVTPLNPDFGTGVVGEQRDIFLTLTNVSAGNVQLTGLSFGGATGGVSASWSNGPAGPTPCNPMVLAPSASCTIQHSVIQNGPGISTYAMNLTAVVIGGDETFALNSVAQAVAAPPASVPVFAPGALALVAGLLGGLGALALRGRPR